MINQVTIHQLRLFLTVAEVKNISRAAEQMDITQPALSAQIKKLEDVLGVKVFDRINRRIELSESGHLLQKYAQKVVQTLLETQQALDDLTGVVQGTIQVGASSTIGNYILPPFLGKFNKLYPNVRIEMVVKNSNQIEIALLKNEIDLGFVEGPIQSDSIEKKLFRMDELIVICSKKHPWRNRTSVTLEEFSKAPLIIREKGSGTRKVFMDTLREAGFSESLNINMELGNTEAIKNSVQGNLGVAVLSKFAVEKELKYKMLHSLRISGVQMKRPLNLVVHKDKYLTTLLKFFISVMDLPPATPKGTYPGDNILFPIP